ncbi:MAG: gas vesicle protein GvpO [bacterium]
MQPKEIIEKAKKQLADLTGFTSPAGIGLKKEKEEWVITIEIVEKKSIPDQMDILGTYDVYMNSEGDLSRYERRGLRKRVDVGVAGGGE